VENPSEIPEKVTHTPLEAHDTKKGTESKHIKKVITRSIPRSDNSSNQKKTGEAKGISLILQ